MGHVLAQYSKEISSWRRSWGTGLAIHSIRISDSVNIRIRIPIHGIGVILLSRRGSTDGSGLISLVTFV